jgi:hypothetical protein
LTSNDKVAEYLKKNKYPAHLVKDGKPGLVRRWKQFVDDVENGYSMTIEDYRNDLDIRAIIHSAGAEDAEVAKLDARLKKLLTGKKRIWDSDCNDDFWCIGYPKNASGDLKDDLKREGLLEAVKRKTAK